MSSPGLNQREAHHAIHQAAYAEAESLTLALRWALRAGDEQQALQVAALLIEHWQAHTLRHAEAEETGWYQQVLAAQPDLQADVIALTRDHELLRLMLTEIQGILSARGVSSGVVERFEAMLLLNSIHSREEERRLLGAEPIVVAAPDDADGAPSASQSDQSSPSADVADEVAATQHSDFAAPVPLAISRPALHAQLDELLRQRGLSSVDLLADLRADAEGRVVLHVAYGSGFAQMSEWPLEDNSTAAATEAMLRQIVEACEKATQTDYHTRMRTPT